MSVVAGCEAVAASAAYASTLRTPITPTTPMQVVAANPADQIMSARELRLGLRCGAGADLVFSVLVIVSTFILFVLIFFVLIFFVLIFFVLIFIAVGLRR
jgi:hypothetical protein